MRTSRLFVAALAIALSACGKDNPPPTAPTPPPAPATFTLSGTVTSSQTGAGVSSATVRIVDSANANRNTVTDASGRYSLTGLSQSGFTVSFTATNYTSTSNGVDLTSNKTLDVALTPTPLFRVTGTGANVFTMPTSVARVRIQGTYAGFCENFIIHIAGRSVVNEILGTCSVASARSFDGTFTTTGGVTEVLSSTGIAWTFTEVR